MKQSAPIIQSKTAVWILLPSVMVREPILWVTCSSMFLVLVWRWMVRSETIGLLINDAFGGGYLVERNLIYNTVRETADHVYLWSGGSWIGSYQHLGSYSFCHPLLQRSAFHETRDFVWPVRPMNDTLGTSPTTFCLPTITLCGLWITMMALAITMIHTTFLFMVVSRTTSVTPRSVFFIVERPLSS